MDVKEAADAVLGIPQRLADVTNADGFTQLTGWPPCAQDDRERARYMRMHLAMGFTIGLSPLYIADGVVGIREVLLCANGAGGW